MLMIRKIAREVNRQVTLMADTLSRDSGVSHNGHFDSVNRERDGKCRNRSGKRDGNVRQSAIR